MQSLVGQGLMDWERKIQKILLSSILNHEFDSHIPISVMDSICSFKIFQVNDGCKVVWSEIDWRLLRILSVPNVYGSTRVFQAAVSRVDFRSLLGLGHCCESNIRITRSCYFGIRHHVKVGSIGRLVLKMRIQIMISYLQLKLGFNNCSVQFSAYIFLNSELVGF